MPLGNDADLPAGACLTAAFRVLAEAGGPRQEPVAEELPVALVYNRFPFAVMMATPADLEDLAMGFSLTEQIVGEPGEISAIEARPGETGIEVHVTLAKPRYLALRERHRRGLLAGSSCGLCGTDSFDEALRPLAPVGSDQVFEPASITRAMAGFPAFQPLNRQVGAVHAAAFAAADGQILAAREDVGRHNALDKVVGHLARRGLDRTSGFLAVSSRCSYEMVHKTAAAGVPLIAAVSAPTRQGIELAEATAVGLVAFAREGRFTVYATPSRVRGVPPGALRKDLP